MKNRTISRQHYLISTGCFVLVLVGVISYMYFVSLSIVHVVMQKEAASNIIQLRSEIATLETAYIEAKHNISSQLASAEGFTSVDSKIFISMGEQSLVLRTNGF